MNISEQQYFPHDTFYFIQLPDADPEVSIVN